MGSMPRVVYRYVHVIWAIYLQADKLQIKRWPLFFQNFQEYF